MSLTIREKSSASSSYAPRPSRWRRIFDEPGIEHIPGHKIRRSEESRGLVIWPMAESAKEKCYRVYECSMTNACRRTGFLWRGKQVHRRGTDAGRPDPLFHVEDWTRDPELTTDVTYKGGGTDTYPEEEDKSMGAYADFLVTYEMDLGEPEYEAIGEIEESIGLSESQAGETDE